jgi:DNA uptake protein ComE-like DNA-binding protein
MALIANIIVLNLKTKPFANQAVYERIWNEWNKSLIEENNSVQELFVFDPNKISEEKLDSLLIPAFIKRNLISYRKAGGKFSSADDFRKVYGMNDSIFNIVGPFISIEQNIKSKKLVENKKEIKITGFFDPNKTNVNELKKFGFNDFQAKNLLNYTKSGGVFITVEDLHKIYGIDSTFYSVIKNHVQIEKRIEKTVSNKKPEIVTVELNGADSVQLIQLSGIGPAYASRILKYRELLGGFYSKRQLLEVYNFPEETYQNIEALIKVDTLFVKKIRLNFAEYNELLRHPYLNKDQVRSILTYREKNGAFQEISSIHLIKGIDEKTRSKILPYLTCR